MTFYVSIVIFVDKERLNDDKKFMNTQPNQIIKLIQKKVNDFDQKMPFLVLQGELVSYGEL